MIFTFLLAFAVVVAALLLPGFFMLWGSGRTPISSLVAAPILSVGLVAVTACALPLLGVGASFITLLLPWVVLGLAVRLIRHVAQAPSGISLFAPQAEDARLSAHIRVVTLAICLGIALAALTTTVTFLSRIAGVDALIQNYDNVFHINRIHAFAQSGNFSSFQDPSYPSAWHALPALAERTLGCASALAENAANCAIIIVAYPLSVIALLLALFPTHPRRVIAGAVFCLGAAFFPWRLFMFGPLFPNVASFSIMSAEAAFFVRLLAPDGQGVSKRLFLAALFLAGGVALALTQPNAIFSTAVFLAPFVLMVLWGLGARKGRARAVALALLGAAVMVAVWLGLQHLPIFEGVVSYQRDTPLDVFKAIRWWLGFCFVKRAPNYTLFLFALIGVAWALFKRERAWWCVSWILLGLLYVVSISVEPPLKNLLVGFWYSDYYRVAAGCCVYAVPVVAQGADGFCSLVLGVARRISRRVEKTGNETSRAAHAKKPGDAPAAMPPQAQVIACSAILALFFVYNLFSFPFLPLSIRTFAFDTAGWDFGNLYPGTQFDPLTTGEVSFLEEAKDIVGDDLVANVPFDGSALAYAEVDMNVLFRAYNAASSPDVDLIRTQLCDVATNPEVAAAAERLGIRYVLLLDSSDGLGDGISEDGTISGLGFDPDEWLGISTIGPDTPGFELVLERGDERLYELVG